MSPIVLITNIVSAIFVLLSLIYSVKIYQLIKARSMICLILAFSYCLIVRIFLVLFDIGVYTLNPEITAIIRDTYYILFFMGIYGLYNTVRKTLR